MSAMHVEAMVKPTKQRGDPLCFATFANPLLGGRVVHCVPVALSGLPVRLATFALATGAATFDVKVGRGSAALSVAVSVPQDAAERVLQRASDQDATMRGVLRSALAARDRRFLSPEGTGR